MARKKITPENYQKYMRGGADKKENGRRKFGNYNTLYHPKYADIARKLIGAGGTGYELRKALRIGQETYYRWFGEHPEFRDACRFGSQQADNRSEMTLFELANGYKYEEEVISKDFDEQGNEIEKVTVVEKQVPPNIAAIKFLLINRRGNKWKEKQEVTHNHNVTIVDDASLYQILIDQNTIDGEFQIVEEKKED